MADFEPYTPQIANPYPPKGWKRIGDFRYDSHLYLMRAKKRIQRGGDRESQYLTATEYVCSYRLDDEPQRREIRVPSGMLTDLASVPWAARLVVNRIGPHLEAAIMHDFLFIAWQDVTEPDGSPRGDRDDDFRFANALMIAAMEAARVPGWQVLAVRLAIGSFIARGVYRENDRKRGRTLYVRVPEAEQREVTPAQG
jgi:hypothetical protein